MRAQFPAPLPHLIECLVKRVVSEKRFHFNWKAGAHKDFGFPSLQIQGAGANQFGSRTERQQPEDSSLSSSSRLNPVI
jgi:hypothetical protein